MSMETKIPLPISFNPLKHHLDYILYFLKEASASEIQVLIESLCHNNVDLYNGYLSSEAICRSVISLIKRQKVFEPELFEQWIASSVVHRKLTLEDNSVWILQKGDEGERYLHIHPAKYGTFSIRFKGATLKTVYQLKKIFDSGSEQPSLEKVNQARVEIGLSPIKRLVPDAGILRCWDFFSTREVTANASTYSLQ